MADLKAVVARYLWMRRGLIALALGTSLAVVFEAAALVMLVLLMQELVDTADGVSGSLGPIEITLARNWLILGAAASVLLSGVAQGLVVFQRSRLAAVWQHRTRMQLLDAYQSASWEEQDRDRDGQLVAVFSNHIGQGAIAMNHVAGLMRGVVGIAIFVATALLIDAVAAFAVMLAGIVLVGLTRPVVSAGRRASERLSRVDIGLTEALTTRTIANLDFRAYGVEREAASTFADLADESRRARTWGAFHSGIGTIIYRTAGMAMLVIVATLALTIDDLPVARLGVATLLLYRSISYGQLVQQSVQRVAEVAPYLEQFDEELERYGRAHRDPSTVDLTTIDQIEVVDLSYVPLGSLRPTLSDVNLQIERGEIIGLVGPSGAGKTTFARLLIGVCEPTDGRVGLGGVDAHRISAASRRALVAWVAQDAQLIPGTIRENVVFHRTGIADEAVLASLRAAGLDDVLATFPDGIDTIVGSGGRTLSGGQRQRLCIARALAGAPDLIVFDEPTSALDIDAESIISDAVAALRGRTTAVVIAHRAATVAACDRIVTLADGVVEHDGTRLSSSESSAFAGRLLGARAAAG